MCKPKSNQVLNTWLIACLLLLGIPGLASSPQASVKARCQIEWVSIEVRQKKYASPIKRLSKSCFPESEASQRVMAHSACIALTIALNNYRHQIHPALLLPDHSAHSREESI